MELDILSFSTNWNHKLDCDAYTTIRIFNPHKHYPGKRFKVALNGVEMHMAEVIEVKQILLSQVNEFIARLDTGYSADECKTILKSMYNERAEKAVYGFLLLKKVK